MKKRVWYILIIIASVVLEMYNMFLISTHASYFEIEPWIQNTANFLFYTLPFLIIIALLKKQTINVIIVIVVLLVSSFINDLYYLGWSEMFSFSYYLLLSIAYLSFITVLIMIIKKLNT